MKKETDDGGLKMLVTMEYFANGVRVPIKNDANPLGRELLFEQHSQQSKICLRIGYIYQTMGY